MRESSKMASNRMKPYGTSEDARTGATVPRVRVTSTAPNRIALQFWALTTHSFSLRNLLCQKLDSNSKRLSVATYRPSPERGSKTEIKGPDSQRNPVRGNIQTWTVAKRSAYLVIIRSMSRLASSAPSSRVRPGSQGSGAGPVRVPVKVNSKQNGGGQFVPVPLDRLKPVPE